MQARHILLAALCAGACSTTVQDNHEGETSTDTHPTDTNTKDTDSGTADTGLTNFTVSYQGGRYQIMGLLMPSPACGTGAPGVDVDGNGVPDGNKISQVLNSINMLMPDVTDTCGANELITALLASGQANVLLQTRMDGPIDMTLGVSEATRDELTGDLVPSDTDPSGFLKQQEHGAFINATQWRTTVGDDLVLPFAYEDGGAPVKFSLRHTVLLGNIEPDHAHLPDTMAIYPISLEGYLAGAFSTKDIQTDIADPVIEAYYEGDPTETARVKSVVGLLLKQAADIDTQSDDPKISALFRFYAVDTTW